MCERGEEEGGVGEKRVHSSEIQSTYVWDTYMDHISKLDSLFQIELGRLPVKFLNMTDRI